MRRLAHASISALLLASTLFAAGWQSAPPVESRPAGTQPVQTQPAATQPSAPPASAPASTIPAKQGPLFAQLKTSKGPVRIELFPDKAPVTVANFCNLARRGFFDGTPCSATTMVVRMFGAPGGALTYRPGYTIKRELHPTLKFDGPGDVAMVKDRDTTNSPSHGTQFFLTVKAQDRWTLDFAIFGSVVQGQSVVNALTQGDTLESVVIEGDPTPILTRYATLVEKWNAALDADPGNRPADTETTGSPLLRKPPS